MSIHGSIMLLLSALALAGCAGGPESIPLPAAPTAPAPPDTPSASSTSQEARSPHTGLDVELIPESVDPPRIEWTESIDFAALRDHYGRRRDFASRCERTGEKSEAVQSLDAEDATRTIELTESLLAHCPVDPIVHHWRYAALMSLGLEGEAEVHRGWVVGLLDSILETGDGKTKETAFVTISVGEEYAVLSYLGLTPKEQGLISGPTMLDAIRVENEQGEEQTVYFDPALHFIRLMLLME